MPAKEKPTRHTNVTFPTERSRRRERLRQALKTSAGAWSDEDHPDLATARDVEQTIRRLREPWMLRTRDEIIEEQKIAHNGQE